MLFSRQSQKIWPYTEYTKTLYYYNQYLQNLLMSYKFVFGAKRKTIPLLNKIKQSKNMVSSGVRLAKDQLGASIHGPTASEVLKDVDLSGKTCMVTGASSGLGAEMARAVAARGARVLAACRNKYSLIHQTSSAFHCYETNLASFRSVADCCNRLLENEKQLDIVILNAAVFGIPWTLTEDMLETTFQVNFLSQLYLLMKIQSILATDARVVFMSSESHRYVKWSIDQQEMPTETLVSLPESQYTSIRAYNISKLCGLLAMHYFAYVWSHTRRQIFGANPGSFVKTRLCRNWWVYEALYTSMLPFSKTISQAASTPLYCATSPELAGVKAGFYKDLRRCDESELASDFHLAFRIMDLSKELLISRTGALVIDQARDPSFTKLTGEDLSAEYST